MEQVWLPAIGQTVHLNGEYEVSDFKDGAAARKEELNDVAHRKGSTGRRAALE